MKKITAYIHSFMTEKVTDTLRDGKIHGVTVIKCEGFGRLATDGGKAHYRDEDVEIGFASKTKIEIVCSDKEVDAIIKIIQSSAHTGKYGDGKIFVSDIHKALDIRTGKIGDEVL